MNYYEFPTQRPNEAYITVRVADAICQFYRPCKPNGNDMVDYALVDEAVKIRSRILTVPKGYSTYILSLLYRRFALAILLHHHQQEEIRPYKVWVTFAQNFLHVDRLWDQCIAESDESNMINAQKLSNILDKYIVTEALVKRHEPVYVSDYRRRRTPQMLNISQATLADIQWRTYTDSLRHLWEWSGGRFGYFIPHTPVAENLVEKLLAQAREWYDDTNRPTILDPYTSTWSQIGWEPRDPFDPEVDDNITTDEDEGGDGDGDEDEDEDEDEGEMVKKKTRSMGKAPTTTPKVQPAVSKPQTRSAQAGKRQGAGMPVASTSTSNPQQRISQKRERSGSNVAAAKSPPKKRPGKAKRS